MTPVCKLQYVFTRFSAINVAYVPNFAKFTCLTLDPFSLKREVIPQHAMPGYGETRLAEPEHWEICESWLTSAEKIVTLKYPAWRKMTALSECAVEKEGLHGLTSRIKLIDSDC